MLLLTITKISIEPPKRPARGNLTGDGEALVCDSAGVSDFDRLRAALARRGSSEAFLYALRPARARRPRPAPKPMGRPPRGPRAGAARGRPGHPAVRAPGRRRLGHVPPRPAPWVSRASCPSGGIGPTARVDRRTGSRWRNPEPRKAEERKAEERKAESKAPWPNWPEPR